MVRFLLGTSGTGKSSFLINKIYECTKNNIKPIIIIPDQFSFDFDKKLYKILGAEKYNMADALSFSRLSENIFCKYGGKSGEYADELTKFTIMYQAVQKAVNEKALCFFHKQAQKQNFSEYMLNIVQEFKKFNITPDILYEKSVNIKNQVKEKIEDIALIYSLYENILEKNQLKDKLNNISEASEIASKQNFFRNKTIFIDEFESFPADELQMLDVIISQSKDVYISLRIDNLNSISSVFSSSVSAYSKLKNIAEKYCIKTEIIRFDKNVRFKSEELSYLSSNIFRYKKIPVYAKPCNNIHIVETKDFYQEAEFVCSEICRLVKDENYKFNKISIVSRYPEEYSGIFEACFKRYHIPFFMDIEKSVMHTSIMLFVVNLLEMISSNKPDTETILKFAKTQLLGINYEHISFLENYCYKWNIQGYTWNSPFTEEIENTPFIEDIRKKIIEPVNKLKEKCHNATGLEICTALFEYFEQMNIPANISGLALSYNNNGYSYTAKELKRLWGNLMDIFDTLANMLDDTKISIDKFNSLLNSMLRQNKYSNPPHSLDAVSFSDASRARFNEPKTVFVIGVNEGRFPAIAKQDGLLSENDRNILKSNGIELSKTFNELISDENFNLYKSVSAPSEKLYISYPLSDETGNSLFASGILNTIQSMFNTNLKCYASDFDMTFYSPTPESAYYNYVQNFNKNNSETGSIEYVLNTIPLYMEKIKYLKSINQNCDFRIENKNLIRRALSDKLNISATKFENYNQCHFKFFCHYILKIQKRTKKDLSALCIGNIIHNCLENILETCCSKKEFINLSEKKIKSMITENMNIFRENELGGNFSKTARFEANYKKIKDTVYEIITHLQEEFLQSEFHPVNYELKISEYDRDKPLKIITSSGIEVILNGKIDRVDIFEHDGKKYIRIIDYKSGKKSFSIENLLYGLDMQMFIYLFSVISSSGRYKGSIPAGVLYQPYSKTKCDIKNNIKSIKNLKNENYHMKGVVLQNRLVLNAMEKDIQGIYIPAKLKKDDKGEGELILNQNSSSLSEKQFNNLEKFLKKQICELTENLYSGDISANPLKESDSDNDCCKYCDYNEICGDAYKLHSRSKDDNAKEKIIELLNSDEENQEDKI